MILSRCLGSVGESGVRGPGLQRRPGVWHVPAVGHGTQRPSDPRPFRPAAPYTRDHRTGPSHQLTSRPRARLRVPLQSRTRVQTHEEPVTSPQGEVTGSGVGACQISTATIGSVVGCSEPPRGSMVTATVAPAPASTSAVDDPSSGRMSPAELMPSASITQSW